MYDVSMYHDLYYFIYSLLYLQAYKESITHHLHFNPRVARVSPLDVATSHESSYIIAPKQISIKKLRKINITHNNTFSFSLSHSLHFPSLFAPKPKPNTNPHRVPVLRFFHQSIPPPRGVAFPLFLSPFASRFLNQHH